MRVVIDTNVLVSALLSPHGPPAQVLRLSLQGELIPLHDDRVLAEYRDVLSRSRFDFDPDDVTALLDGIAWTGDSVLARPIDVRLPDPWDLPFLEVAAAGRADALVTGNLRHFQPTRGEHAVPVLSPRDLLAHLSR